jgi:hypothetical protein
MALLPKAPGLKLENAAIDAESVSFTLTSTSLPVACPVCGHKTARLHSHYGRAVADLPWGGRCVRLRLNVRKFRCPRKECPRRIFTECLPNLIEPYARKTVRLREVLELVGFALGGEGGARLIGRLGMEASATTLLRYIREAPFPEIGRIMLLSNVFLCGFFPGCTVFRPFPEAVSGSVLQRRIKIQGPRQTVTPTHRHHTRVCRELGDPRRESLLEARLQGRGESVRLDPVAGTRPS